MVLLKLFHGDDKVIERPEFTDGFYKDFGYGFYCTKLEKQAKRWALTKRDDHIVNQYEYNEAASLKMIEFKEMSNQWLDFVVACRRGITHSYDLVEGPMADDTITLCLVIKIMFLSKLHGEISII